MCNVLKKPPDLNYGQQFNLQISALVDIFHFQFSTSIPPRTLLATPIKTKIWILSIPELPPFQPEVNRGKQLVATWFTLVAPKSENLFSIYDEKKKKMLGLSVTQGRSSN